jgi:hypothetical protein
MTQTQGSALGTFLSIKKVSQDNGCGFAIDSVGNFNGPEAAPAQGTLRIFGGVAFVLKEERELQREFQITPDAPNLFRGVSFGAVEPERQTQDYAPHVQLLAKFVERTEQTLPRGARQGLERADGQAQLVRDGQADSLRTHVDGEDATLQL